MGISAAIRAHIVNRVPPQTMVDKAFSQEPFVEDVSGQRTINTGSWPVEAGAESGDMVGDNDECG